MKKILLLLGLGASLAHAAQQVNASKLQDMQATQLVYTLKGIKESLVGAQHGVDALKLLSADESTIAMIERQTKEVEKALKGLTDGLQSLKKVKAKA